MTEIALRSCGTKKRPLDRKDFVKRLGSCEDVTHGPPECLTFARDSYLNTNPQRGDGEKTTDTHRLAQGRTARLHQRWEHSIRLTSQNTEASMGQAYFPDSKSLIPRDPFLTVPQEPRGWGKVPFVLPARYCQSLSVAIQKYHPQLASLLTLPKARMPRWQQTWCR